MATGFEFFERDLKVATAGLEPEAINAAVARFAKQELRRVIAEGAGSPNFDRYVNAVRGAPEESFEAPGSIVYVFNWWKVVILRALTELEKRSPRKSGRYAKSFIVIVDGKPTTSFDSIPSAAEVIITNVQPYTRKVQVGAMKMSVPPRLFDRARQTLNRTFGGRGNVINVETRFLTFQPGIHPLVPYILKGGDQRTSSISALATWHGVPKPVIEGWLRRGQNVERPRAKARKDRTAGQPLTYPSLVINLSL